MDDQDFFKANANAIDIVDSQFHIGRGEITSTLRAMDALGIRSLLIDEFWGEFGTSDPTHIQPGRRLANGAWRAAWPTAEEASLLHPERFDLAPLMRVIASSPRALAFRVQPAWTLNEVNAFAAGEYDPLFALAEELSMPVCLFIPGYTELVRRYAQKFTQLTFIIDHCGVGFPGIPHGRPSEEAQPTLLPTYLDTVCQLADLPNVALKWSHAQNLLGGGCYPYEALWPLLKKMIAAFGRERIMWASDNSVVPNHTWAETLHYVRDNPELSQLDKEWVLGRAARQLLNWSIDE
jgi:L-fuconolactonase